MKEPLTDELLSELLNAPNPLAFVEENRIGARGMSEYLQYLLDEHGLLRADVVREAGLNETFGYQIFMGQRGASRNKVLQLAFAMHLSLKEADRLLQAAGANGLYCKNRRDAIIIFCLDHGYGLQKTDEELYRFNEDTIC
ncbi:XRE family transcriptional regulator [Eggerthella sinensis]|uniref:Transcriptional regulator n=1 Tax=Eggerthella sinensis TaxID=242230 RepID=A0A3N0IV09_9ACTN|nr:XRE family transcriptional regulator [Eggerthella sinensis]RDB68074.1 transcriptional regulator [Eggerthella sinensis]RNM40803.1 transcriptional regulator [Eggerthella sinensis]